MKKGVSLIETVVAIFVMLGSFLLITNLFQSSLRYESQISLQVQATHLADQTLRQISTFASQYSQFAQMGVSLYSPSSPYATDSGPYHVVVLSSAGIFQASPSVSLESVFIGPPDNRKTMTNSLKTVQVTVSWDPLHPTQNVLLVTNLAEPPRTKPAVVITAVSAVPPSLAELATVQYKVELVDADKLPIPDVFFEWSVIPVSGSGTIITQPRNGQTVTFENELIKSDGSVGFNPVVANCYLQASCTYQGVLYTGKTSGLGLQP